jgi:CheY-like chemotaxis protein
VEADGAIRVAVKDGRFVLASKKYQQKPDGALAPTNGSWAKSTRPPERVLRVLVVEDNPDSLQTLTFIIRGLGHSVSFATDGNEALKVAKEFRPDFVLLDIGLPGIDGIDVCRHIRRDPELKACRVVMLTGYGQDQDRKRAMEAGCDLYFTKPMDIDVLEELLS